MKNKVTKITNLINLLLVISFFIGFLFLLPTPTISINTVDSDLIIYVLGVVVGLVLYTGMLYLLQLLFVINWCFRVSFKVDVAFVDTVFEVVNNIRVNKQNTYKLNCVVRC